MHYLIAEEKKYSKNESIKVLTNILQIYDNI